MTDEEKLKERIELLESAVRLLIGLDKYRQKYGENEMYREGGPIIRTIAEQALNKEKDYGRHV